MKNSQPLRVTIAELLRCYGDTSPDKQFQCEAQIVAINNSENWFYDSCFDCHKKLIKYGAQQSYWCPCCRKWCERPVSWYYLAVKVTDNTETTEFKLIGKQAEQIVGVPASRVRHEPNPHQYFVPPRLNSIIRKTVTFTVKFDLESFFRRGFVSFIVCRADAVPPYAQLPAQEAPPLPVHVTHLPLPRRDIAQSSRHPARDNGKRKVDEQRQLDEADSTRPAKMPFISSQGYQARR